MTAVTADWNLRVLKAVTTKFVLDSSAAELGYKGEPLVIDQNVDSANVTFCHDTTHPHLVAQDVFMGIAASGVNNAISVAEDLNHGVEAYIDGSIIGYPTSSLTNANAGATYYYESGALSTEGTDTPPIGKLLFVSDGYAYILITTAICTGADS